MEANFSHASLKDVVLQRTESNHTLAVAKRITAWLLKMALEADELWQSQPSFRTKADSPSSSLQICDLLLRHSNLLQKQTEHLEFLASVFEHGRQRIDSIDSKVRRSKSRSKPNSASLRLFAILDRFPMVLDLPDNVQKRRACSVCDIFGSIND
jgi:hypothetical protein